MCPKCNGFAEIIRIRHPRDYYGLVRQLREIVTEGTFVLEKSTCELSTIQKGETWPDDYIEHHFKCQTCGQRFRLAVETYHGSGGAWEPIDANAA